MKVRISDHFTFKNIFKITIFPIVTMVFISLYSIVDGIFISNFTGNGDAFAAVNLVFPFIMIIGSIGFMLGTGGTALVSKLLGEKKPDEANKAFSLVIYTTIIIGIIFSVIGSFTIEPIVRALGTINPSTTEGMVKQGIRYGRILMFGQVLFMLQNVFQSFLMVSEKSRAGFIFTLSAGLTNMLFDGLFIGLCGFGVEGAAYATIIGYFVGGFGPLLFFIINKKTLIKLGKPTLDLKVVGKSIYNGLSEFVGQVSMSVVSIVYNSQLLREYGPNGVSAYGIIMYVSFVFMAIFIGYSLGLEPVVGYNYGAKNHDELKNILKKSSIIIVIASLIMFALAMIFAKPFSRIFSNGNVELIELSTYAMMVYSITFLVCGYSIFTSCFFTGLNNGTISAIISLSRTLLFQVAFAYLFPLIFGAVGLWWGVVCGEIGSTITALIFLFALRKKYGY